MKLGAKIFGGLAILFGLYLLVGLALPGSWSAEIEEVLPAPPSRVFPYFNRMALWPQWSPMPPSGIELFGPPEGMGAGLRWNDAQYGRGEIRILSSVEGRSVDYEVLVEGGTLTINGKLILREGANETHLLWREEGDFGRNPLMGFAARKMPETQAEAMRASIEDLRALF